MKGIIPQSGKKEGTCNLGGNKNFTWWEWSNFFGNYCKKLKGIKTYYYCHTNKRIPGVIFYKINPNDEWECTNLAKEMPKTLPPTVEPEGLSRERQKYLYENIRQHVIDETEKDNLCPPL